MYHKKTLYSVCTKWKPRPQLKPQLVKMRLFLPCAQNLSFVFGLRTTRASRWKPKWLLDEIPLSPSLRYHLYLSVLIFWSKNILLKNLKENKNKILPGLVIKFD